MGQGYQPPSDLQPSDLLSLFETRLENQCNENTKNTENNFTQKSSPLVPFLACGDLSGFDSDKTYSLEKDYVSLDPIQEPLSKLKF